MERQRKVLVVDDDPFALESMAKVLEGESYQVATVAGGSEALDLLRQDSFDLVLTDLKMPEVDGLEVLRQAREMAPQAGGVDPHRICLSGVGDRGLARGGV